ncbi:MAG: nuclear transport factor 2 family protein [Proteobacteria bacterium]|nr:nuclear transport factor 2 family protein [Pseudomonadota bacterium]
MTYRPIPTIAATIAAFLAISAPATADVDPDVAAVSKAIHYYFDGTENGNIESLKRAFLDTAELQFVRDGRFQRWPVGDYIARFKPGKKNNRVGRLISIDISGTAAVAKAEIVMGKRRYTDYFLLLKVAGRWWISNKTFYAHPPPQ